MITFALGVNIFNIVCTETRHIPVGDVRKHWAAHALLEKDKELKEIEARHQKRVFAACEKIVLAFNKVKP